MKVLAPPNHVINACQLALPDGPDGQSISSAAGISSGSNGDRSARVLKLADGCHLGRCLLSCVAFTRSR